MQDRPENERANEPRTEPMDPARAENPSEPMPEALEEPEEKQRPEGIMAVFWDAFRRARHGQKPGSNVQRQNNPLVSDRSARNRDRTKTLFVSVVGLVVVLVIFLGVFSSSHTGDKREQGVKRNPSWAGRRTKGSERVRSRPCSMPRRTARTQLAGN